MKKYKLLFVDDDRNLSKIMKIQLEKKGFEVQIAETAPQAKTALSRAIPDVMVVDLKMPVWNGIDLIKMVRRRERFNDVTIVALTGFDSPDKKEKAISAGANLYLCKPITPEQLALKIRNFLETKSKK